MGDQDQFIMSQVEESASSTNSSGEDFRDSDTESVCDDFYCLSGKWWNLQLRWIVLTT